VLFLPHRLKKSPHKNFYRAIMAMGHYIFISTINESDIFREVVCCFYCFIIDRRRLFIDRRIPLERSKNASAACIVA
jgi:hypothetical protein